jgi:hypothetical protein
VTRGPHSRSEDRGVDEPEGSSVGRSEDPPANPKTRLGLSSVRRSRRIPARVTGPGPELPVSLLLRVTVPAIRRSGFRLSGPRWSGASGFPHRRDRKSRPHPEARQIERLIDFREPLFGFRDPNIGPCDSRGEAQNARNPEGATTEVAALSGFSNRPTRKAGPWMGWFRRDRSLSYPEQPKFFFPRFGVSPNSVTRR